MARIDGAELVFDVESREVRFAGVETSRWASVARAAAARADVADATGSAADAGALNGALARERGSGGLAES